MSAEKLDFIKLINSKFRVAQLDSRQRKMNRLHLMGKGLTPKEADAVVDLERQRRLGRFK